MTWLALCFSELGVFKLDSDLDFYNEKSLTAFDLSIINV